MRATLLAAALTMISSSIALAQTSAPASSAVIVTQGSAVVKRAPDRAWISVATETREPKAADARRRGAEAMTAVQSALKAAGVASDAIRTTGYSLAPDEDWNAGRRTVKGYLVRNQIEVRIDDLDKLGDVLDAADSAKSTTLTVSGPRFDLKDSNAAEAEALRLAVEDGMGRARAIATGAKRTLGGIVKIEEQGGHVGPPPMPMFRTTMADASQAPTPITPGEIEVRAQVTLTVEVR